MPELNIQAVVQPAIFNDGMKGVTLTLTPSEMEETAGKLVGLPVGLEHDLEGAPEEKVVGKVTESWVDYETAAGDLTKDRTKGTAKRVWVNISLPGDTKASRSAIEAVKSKRLLGISMGATHTRGTRQVRLPDGSVVNQATKQTYPVEISLTQKPNIPDSHIYRYSDSNGEVCQDIQMAEGEVIPTCASDDGKTVFGFTFTCDKKLLLNEGVTLMSETSEKIETKAGDGPPQQTEAVMSTDQRLQQVLDVAETMKAENAALKAQLAGSKVLEANRDWLTSGRDHFKAAAEQAKGQDERRAAMFERKAKQFEEAFERPEKLADTAFLDVLDETYNLFVPPETEVQTKASNTRTPARHSDADAASISGALKDRNSELSRRTQSLLASTKRTADTLDRASLSSMADAREGGQSAQRYTEKLRRENGLSLPDGVLAPNRSRTGADEDPEDQAASQPPEKLFRMDYNWAKTLSSIALDELRMKHDPEGDSYGSVTIPESKVPEWMEKNRGEEGLITFAADRMYHQRLSGKRPNGMVEIGHDGADSKAFSNMLSKQEIEAHRRLSERRPNHETTMTFATCASDRYQALVI